MGCDYTIWIEYVIEYKDADEKVQKKVIRSPFHANMPCYVFGNEEERLLAVPGIDVNKAMNNGATPLYIVSQNGHLPIVERLLAVPGIDVNKAMNNGATPLFVASQNGHIPILALM